MNEPHQPVDPSSQRYLIALPTGTEGPYTVEELRSHLRTRRLNPSDRVLSEGDKKSRLLSELIPEAESLQVRTDRVVRRKSTDGEGQSPPATPRGNPATDSQARRYRTPLSVAALPADAGDAAHAAKPETTVPTRPIPQKQMTLVLAVSVLLSCVGLILWQTGMFEAYGDGNPGFRWRVTFKGNAGGPWTLILKDRDLTTISPTNQREHFNVRQTFEAGGRMRLEMKQPHPQLGRSILISLGTPAEIVSEHDTGSGEVIH